MQCVNTYRSITDNAVIVVDECVVYQIHIKGTWEISDLGCERVESIKTQEGNPSISSRRFRSKIRLLPTSVRKIMRQTLRQ
jgi:hypothetical protein